MKKDKIDSNGDSVEDATVVTPHAVGEKVTYRGQKGIIRDVWRDGTGWRYEVEFNRQPLKGLWSISHRSLK